MEEIKKLQEIQNEIKKELGGSSLNHLFKYFKIIEKNKKDIDIYTLLNPYDNIETIKLKINRTEEIFYHEYKVVNEENQALNVFGQTEEFQRKLYEIIIMLKNTN
jgi:hypothetical protein